MDIVHFFKRSIEHDKLSHLYMIVGPKGELRTKLILSVIHEISGLGFHTKDDALESSQIHWIEAEHTQIKKQQITTLQEEFSKTSLSEGKRIYVIEDIENLNNQSANALLKFLEEPLSGKTIGLLLTNHPEQILETILSRSQRLDMTKTTKLNMVQFLRSIDGDETVKEVIAEVSKDTSEAENLMVSPDIIQLSKILKEMASYIDSSSSFEAYLLHATKGFQDNHHVIEYFIHLMYRWILDIKKNDRITFDVLENVKSQWIENINTNKIDYVLESLQEFGYRLRYNVNLDTIRRQYIHVLKEIIRS
jgi:DNA polymerase-3 subunit delta'